MRIAARDDVAVVFPVHPNPNVVSVMDRILGDQPDIARIAPLDHPSFVRALGLAGDRPDRFGRRAEEAPALGKPVLVMRETTERPEGVEAGTARLVGTSEDRIVSEIFTLLDDKAAYSAMARAHESVRRRPRRSPDRRDHRADHCPGGRQRTGPSLRIIRLAFRY
ncbi:UDP-N-acetylglucosamine 2-epimerase [Sphingomonas aerolata]|uniref:UDP-N-acetylglucosamine 2-epimerase n=1 Tax=Sphingomonas aerolata TaxID=185951 RepID=UPI003A5BD7EF